MGDVVKALVSAPANAVLLVAGLAFLAVAIFRRVTDRLDAGPKGRWVAGVLGFALIALSLYLSAGRDTTTEAPSVSTEPAASSTQPATTAVQPAESLPADLPAGQDVKGEDRSYSILKITLDRHGIDQLSLAVAVRMTNHTNYPGNFWNANFRLLADGVPTAPSGDLNEVVDGNAAKEGTVRFVIPGSTKTAVLQIDNFGEGAPGIPIALPAQP